jgi:hypothetical protein
MRQGYQRESKGPVGTIVPVHIYGSYFPECAYISISVSGSGVTADNASWNGPDSISADFHIAADATAGDHTVTVSFNFVETTSVTFYVQVPTSLQYISSGISSGYQNHLGNGCRPDVGPGLVGGTTAGPYGMLIFIRYQVMDQANPAQPIVATLPLREDLVNFLADGQSVPGDVNNGLVTISGTTESDGKFTDPYVGGCSEGAFTLASFDQDLFTSTNHTLDVRGNHWVLTGRSGCGQMQNGNDVTVTVNCP